MSTDAASDLLRSAQEGDEGAFAALLAPHRTELHALCYRMLGSVDDAEDLLQDVLVRAWRGLPGFEGRSALRTWLYRLTMNACLNHIERRPPRTLPLEYGAPAGPGEGPGDKFLEPIWLGPYPDRYLDGEASLPDAVIERRESVELAFVAALTHLNARSRAVLLLRLVLGFSAEETAGMLDTSVAAANSAL
jgi:RNA polymerase sigma-70 factor (ECF subfamily)